jgi:steroid delta-isomerase-like uncharacterized protein
MLISMSEANKALAKDWFEQVWNQQNEAAISRLLHPQGKCHGFPDSDTALVGPEAFKEVHRVFCRAFPDIHVAVEDVIAEGDRVAVRWSAAMTHHGDDLGFPATHKSGSLTGSSFVIVRDGQIIEAWNEMDLHALFRKLQAG